jgi:tRNA 2-thiouridine synthesizing protein A
MHHPTCHFLDIRAFFCPMTFVKTKLMLEQMAEGELVQIWLSYGEAADTLPATLIEQGHVLMAVEKSAGEVRITVKKGTQ